MLFYEGQLRSYLEQNREDCTKIMDKILGSENKKKKENRIVWELNLYDGEDYSIPLEVHMCDDCEWPWIDINFWVMGSIDSGNDFKTESTDDSSFKEKSIEELEKELESEVNKAGDLSKNAKENFQELMSLKNKINVINKVLNEKYYHNKNQEEIKDAYQKRLDFLDRILSKYGTIKKSPFDETRYEIPVFKDEIERQESWCMHIEDIKCKLEEGCYNGECIYALGGNEICNNKNDDDGDNIIDCNDPDCAKECGRICEPD